MVISLVIWLHLNTGATDNIVSVAVLLETKIQNKEHNAGAFAGFTTLRAYLRYDRVQNN